MKILLDENLPVKLKFNLTEFYTYTVRDMSWNSYKNGALLKAAVENEFICFITSDKNIQFQHKLSELNLSFIILNIKLLKWEYIEPLVEKLKETIKTAEIGKIYSIHN